MEWHPILCPVLNTTMHMEDGWMEEKRDVDEFKLGIIWLCCYNRSDTNQIIYVLHVGLLESRYGQTYEGEWDGWFSSSSADIKTHQQYSPWGTHTYEVMEVVEGTSNP